MRKNENEAMLYETLKSIYRGDEDIAWESYLKVALKADVTRTLPEIISITCDTLNVNSFTLSEAYYKVRNIFSAYQFDYEIITEADPLWPQGLKYTDLKFHFLYLVGDRSLLTKTRCAVLGMRQPSLQGKEDAIKAINEVNDAGGVVVSTLDTGLDAYSLLYAYNIKCPSIAVLASPLHQCIPETQKDLMINIANSGGLLISPFPPCAKTQKWFTVPRNRLLVTLADYLVILEEKDGGPLWTLGELSLQAEHKVILFNTVTENPAYTYASRFGQKEGVCIYSRKGDLKRIIAPQRKRSKTKREDSEQLSLFS